MHWKEQLGLLSYSSQISQLIAQLDYQCIGEILDRYLLSEENGRRVWSPDLVEECNQFILGFSPQYNHSYLRLDDDDPYNENLDVWVDGLRIVPNEVSSSKTPLIIYKCGSWVNNELLLMYIQTVGDHPHDTYELFLKNDLNIYKRIYSILLWHCASRKMHIVHPTLDQIWTEPQVREENGQFLTYPNKIAYEQHKPDGLIPYPF
ncbi:MAG: hypothetical protein JAY90_19030 [Candidatus Thiodiazotropha lotti]|nr:hypothetical protein [Candidatus Thiodiazotropha lotti]